MPEKVWATGISGCGKSDYLQRFKKFCLKNGKKLEIFFTGDAIFEIAEKIEKKLNGKNILSANPDVLDFAKAAVFERIIGELRGSPADAAIIADHFCFYFKKGMTPAHASFGYLPYFDPGRFVCFIDGPHVILQRLRKSKEWAFGLDEEKLVYWQENEIMITRILAQAMHKKWFVLPSAESEEVLYRLIFSPDETLVYVSIPITNLLSGEDEKKISVFIAELRKYFPVLVNPLNFPVGKIDLEKNEEDARFHHAVKINDLFIEQADIVVCYTPSLVPTDGVPYEQAKSYEKTKEVWAVYPLPYAGPHKIHFCNRLFKSEEDFFEFLKK